MCYSALIKSSLKELSFEFRTMIDTESFEELYEARAQDHSLKIPRGLDRYFLQTNSSARIAAQAQAFEAKEKERLHLELKKAEDERKELQTGKPTAANKKKIEARDRKIPSLQKKIALKLDEPTPADDRIYPFYFAPVITEDRGQRLLRPMRYRAKMLSGEEVPPQYNVFNARLDSLLSARTWKPLFGKHHLIFPFLRFYEWVENEGRKQEIFFSPNDRPGMWAAGLYAPEKRLGSFAMVTDDPPPEVAAAGHDRCPIFLAKDAWDIWLQPKLTDKETLLALLKRVELTRFLHEVAA